MSEAAIDNGPNDDLAHADAARQLHRADEILRQATSELSSAGVQPVLYMVMMMIHARQLAASVSAALRQAGLESTPEGIFDAALSDADRHIEAAHLYALSEGAR